MILSTSRDIGRYLQALLNDGRAPNGTQLVSVASTQELLRAQQKAESELGGETMYGFRWEISEMNGLKVAMKGGSVGSMGSLFVLIPQQKLGIAMLFNAIDYGKVQLLQNLMKVTRRAQEGAALIFKRCNRRMCMWMRGDSSAVRR